MLKYNILKSKQFLRLPPMTDFKIEISQYEKFDSHSLEGAKNIANIELWQN